jgi:hypothetical protein
MKWFAATLIVLLSGCGVPPADDPAPQSNADDLQPVAPNWTKEVSKPFEQLPSIVATIPEGGTGEWGNIVFYVKRVYQAASDKTCREVHILYPDSAEPAQRLARGTGE